MFLQDKFKIEKYKNPKYIFRLFFISVFTEYSNFVY